MIYWAWSDPNSTGTVSPTLIIVMCIGTLVIMFSSLATKYSGNSDPSYYDYNRPYD